MITATIIFLPIFSAQNLPKPAYNIFLPKYLIAEYMHSVVSIHISLRELITTGSVIILYHYNETTTVEYFHCVILQLNVNIT